MKTRDFSFDLPPELIAQQPTGDRAGSRLLVLDRATGRLEHASVRSLPRFVEPGTVVVLNDTRVRKARLFATTPGGARVELLLLERRADGCWTALVGGARRRGRGKPLRLAEGVAAAVVEGEGGRQPAAQGDERVVRFEPPIDEAYLDRRGHVPLPPYIRRADAPEDAERYQTVYARRLGSAAAPTAGLHFTPELLAELRAAGACLAWVTLHVGLGTFLPIRSEEIEGHVMHEESYEVPEATKAAVESALAAERPVLAVGTTSVRALESAWDGSGLRCGMGRTSLYVTPGYRFRVVSRLFTNFHTPASTLLVLVSAFAGRERILEAYREAIARRYRFWSYGDAMLIR